MRIVTGSNRMYLAAIFSAWIAFHAQSLITIDNIGISIWGWILGGSIIGLSVSASATENAKAVFFQQKKNTIDLSRVMASGLSTLLALVLVALLYRGESNSYKGGENVNLQDPTARAYFRELQLKTINTPLNDPTYSLFAASRLLQSGYVDEGLVEAKKIYLQNPRNLDTLLLLALTHEQLNNLSEAISYREKIVQLDPWNAKNYLALGKYYKQQGDLSKSKEMLNKILSFASANQIANQAKIDLTN
jgi:tetratricopeptide (TPR) repeat protein